MGVREAGVRVELVGRERERARLHALLRRLPALAQLVGEPGIGKTALLADLRRHAAAAGAVVLSGAAAEFEQDRPYGPVADALEPYLPLVDLGALAAGHRDPLAAVFPGLGPAPLASRPRVHRAVAALLDVLATARPLVVVLDDLHWADPETSALVAHLVRSPPRGQVLLALAHRPLAPEELLGARLDRAVAAGSVERLDVGPLDDAAARALLADVAPGPERDELLRACGGNPFHLRQLARAAGTLPGTVADTVLAEVAALPAPAELLLRGAAVVGDPFDVDLAAVAAGLPVPDALQALDHLVGATLVGPTEVPRAFGFRHPLVRRVMRERSGPGWSARAHRRVAEVLAAAGAPPEVRAPHVARAAGLGDRQAAELLGVAADAVAARSPATASRWLADALRLLPGCGPDERHALLTRRADALADAGLLDEAADVLREILALGAGRRVDVVAACAHTAHLRGRRAEALALLDAEVPASPAERAVLAVERAAVLLHTDPAGAAAAVAPHGGAAALAMRALADALVGGPSAAADDPAAAAERALAAGGDPRPDTLLRLGLARSLRDAAAGERHLRHGLALAAGTGRGRDAVPLRTALGFALARRGRLAQARRELDEAVDHARLTGAAGHLAWALLLRCHVRTWTGDLPGALADGRRAVTLTAGRADAVAAHAGRRLAEALLLDGDAAGAAALLRDAGCPEALPPAGRPAGWALLAEVALAAGRHGDARAAADRAGDTYPGLRVRALLAAADGDGTRARELALCAAVAATAPVDRLRARLVAADAAELRAVAAAADELGATTVATLARAGAPRLTERERAVAVLVAAGHSNRRIGAELFLAERTVERHVTAVLAKLGAPNRAAVGGLLAAVTEGRSSAPV